MCIRKVNSEIEELESAASVSSAQAATATSHTDWHHIKSVEVKKTNIPSLLSSGRAQNEKRENEKRRKEREAFEKYHNQGEPRKSTCLPERPNGDLPDLAYRRIVLQQQQNRGQFLNSIPHRVQVKPVLFVWVLIDLQPQEYGTEYWTAVRDVGMVMESFATYIRYA